MQIETKILREYRGVSSSRDLQHALAAFADGQHGVVARRQLLKVGFSEDQVDRLRAARRLQNVHLGVYAVGHRLMTARSWWMAGVLASGPDAQLSHRSCGALTNIRRTSITYVEVTVPQRRGTVAGVRTYVSGRLQPQDCDEIDGIPCTSLARTLLDLAAILPRREVERACDEAEVQRLFDLRAVEDVLERSRGCRGTATLARGPARARDRDDADAPRPGGAHARRARSCGRATPARSTSTSSASNGDRAGGRLPLAPRAARARNRRRALSLHPAPDRTRSTQGGRPRAGGVPRPARHVAPGRARPGRRGVDGARSARGLSTPYGDRDEDPPRIPRCFFVSDRR